MIEAWCAYCGRFRDVEGTRVLPHRARWWHWRMCSGSNQPFPKPGDPEYAA